MKRVQAVSNGFTPSRVEFPSGDGTVVAHLYVPKDYDPTKRYLAVAIAGSFSSVKEQMGGTYAGEMARRGMIGLAIDYRNYGESSGKIRQLEDPKSKAEDLSSAVNYLRSRRDVSNAGLLGICTSATNVLAAAAQDKSIPALATVAGSYFIPKIMLMRERRNKLAKKAREKYEKTGQVDMVPAYKLSLKAVNPLPLPYYISKDRGNVPTWRNETAVMSYDKMSTMDALADAASVTTPTLVVHADGAAFPKLARQVYDTIPGTKELCWTKGGHFSFYDDPEQIRATSDRLVEYFTKYLAK